MGNAVNKTFDKLKAKKEYKILMVGLDAAGKTTILYKLKLGDVVTTIPTIGFNVETVQYKHISFTVWDIGGQDKIRPLWRHYYPNAQGLIYVVDSADHDRVQESATELHNMLKEDDLRNCAVLVLANKQDLPKAKDQIALGEEMKLNTLPDRITWHIQECTATTGQGISTGLDWLSDAIAKKNKELAKKAEEEAAV
mmetsp:Transcript_41943/g.89538  ORF Transcript_41943/g.89538 Transcript_41943/m.89538 type:complete len:196 (-) Transcript_41943:120-707(-)|eukprot:CAMPEP_0183358128 /NCGR_PEP_ID=MMETSP0164_2-20130417/48292_1 /TAXON_ID=221442 /ORGANISM="Coccolithus pelagicus ssp braarudi, Strain PLY182g" /LENGTH=195 /DNA_ID=CAMNT_0025531949 /DNA_START=69 /DNA_END=656 /DNA_ORIENTATION=+